LCNALGRLRIGRTDFGLTVCATVLTGDWKTSCTVWRHQIHLVNLYRKGASIMNADLRLIRHILESRLEEAARNPGLTDSIAIQTAADPIDMTQESGERELAVQILNRKSALARQIRSAIDRINDTSYGICLQCEEEITPKRLKALPWAELCIHCQESADDLANHTELARTLEDRSEAA
jgi:DnaK suppressor protein